jgi:hypothetical protein
MAQREQDREDLLGTASALVERIELQFDPREPTLVAGFRRDGALSLYFGSDPVYQFNAAGQLRRAFVGGQVIKADQGRLASLTRRRGSGAVDLVRHDLSGDESAAFLAELRGRLGTLRRSLSRASYEIVGQVPEGSSLAPRLAAAVERLVGGQLAIAPRPHAR